MAAQILNLTHVVDDKVTSVGDKIKDLNEKMDDIIGGKLAYYFLRTLP